jgi:hypothetical protein
MGVKKQGGYWCDFCGAPVAGEKTTHRARGAAGILAAGTTGGLSLLAAVPDRYHCPNCGGRVRLATAADYERLQAQGVAAGSEASSAGVRVPPPRVAWRDVPVEDVPPWRRHDRERLESSHTEPAGASAPAGDLAAQLDRLAALHDSGALSDEEFAGAKRRLLG